MDVSEITEEQYDKIMAIPGTKGWYGKAEQFFGEPITGRFNDAGGSEANIED